MERLTQWFGSSRLGREVGIAAHLQEQYTEEELLDLFAKRLAAHEDTGLEPEDLQLGLNAAGRKKAGAEYYGLTGEELDRAVELFKANDEKRLVVLPCKVGDTVYKLCPVSPFLKKGDLWSGRIIERDCDMCAYGACDCHDIGPQRNAKNIIHEMTLKSLSAIVRIIPHWGNLYFSSREEAEAALTGR